MGEPSVKKRQSVGGCRSSLAGLALPLAFVGICVLAPKVAEAAAPPAKVAVLGPDSAAILPRLQRNVASMKLDAVHASVTLCSRDVVTRLVNDLHADMAVCTDGDQIGIWVKDGQRLVLKEAVVVQSSDDRAQELAAARATMALQPTAKEAAPSATPLPSSFTIVAGSGSEATVVPPTSDPTAPPPATNVLSGKDAPLTPPPRPQTPRVTPRLVVGLGPALAASRHGNSFAISAEMEIGVSRYVALVPWILTTPANRTAEAPLGTASFRPTIFGFGFTIPLLPLESFIVPRIGTGYGILWMHVSPESAQPTANMRKPEDLLAPVMYATAAGSVKIAQSWRIVAEGMLGASSHDMVVRIAGQTAAHWGVPLASATLRGEWVVQ